MRKDSGGRREEGGRRREEGGGSHYSRLLTFAYFDLLITVTGNLI